MADQHLIMAPHTTEHWPKELFLPATLVDRDNREAWTRAGAKEIDERATDEVNRRLGAYRQLETDPLLDADLQRIIRSGLVDVDAALPVVPPAPEPAAGSGDAGPGRRHNRRRERAG
jgi:trimethylamine:corrinoid methyltransferase-like protein